MASCGCLSDLTVPVCACRLFILGSYDRETYVHCTLELSSQQWKEKPRSSIKQVCCFSIPSTVLLLPAVLILLSTYLCTTPRRSRRSADIDASGAFSSAQVGSGNHIPQIWNNLPSCLFKWTTHFFYTSFFQVQQVFFVVSFYYLDFNVLSMTVMLKNIEGHIYQ